MSSFITQHSLFFVCRFQPNSTIVGCLHYSAECSPTIPVGDTLPYSVSFDDVVHILVAATGEIDEN